MTLRTKIAHDFESLTLAERSGWRKGTVKTDGDWQGTESPSEVVPPMLSLGDRAEKSHPYTFSYGDPGAFERRPALEEHMRTIEEACLTNSAWVFG